MMLSNELVYPPVDSNHFKAYRKWMQRNEKSTKTIRQYLSCLKRMLNLDVDSYLADPETTDKRNLVCAYRSYIDFLTEQKRKLSRIDQADIKSNLKIPRTEDNGDNKWSLSKEDWVKYIEKAPNKIAKMGVWMAFHFGLRRDEVVHLRVEDVDFINQDVLIKKHEKIHQKRQEFWLPKHRRHREIPFTEEHARVFERWIHHIRAKEDLNHPYLLWIEKGHYTGTPVTNGTFYDWCKKIVDSHNRKLKPHILRYSFATHYYEISKDIKWVSDLLGHKDVSYTMKYLCLDKKQTKAKARKYMSI